MVRGTRDRLRFGSWVFTAVCVALMALAEGCLAAQEAAPQGQPRPETLKLREQQEKIVEDARKELQNAKLTDAERQVRLNVVIAVLTGTVGSPDDDNPEVRNPNLWTLSGDSYVVAPNSTAVEAISDLWIVHDNDGVPVPRIWCNKYASLVLAKAFIQHFQDTGDKEGLAALNQLIGHKVFPNGLTREETTMLWTWRRGDSNLLPGDQVWFHNPYFEKGRALLKETACKDAIGEGKSPEEAAKYAEATAQSLAVAEEGSNVFYLGNNLVARGAFSTVRTFRGKSGDPGEGAADYEQTYTKKVYTIPQYEEHFVECFYTVQACMDEDPSSVHLGDFQIQSVRSLCDPEIVAHPDAQAPRIRQLDRLIDAMASRNQEPKLVALGDGRIPLFSKDYDWSEQDRVREAMIEVLRTATDAMWWRLRERGNDNRYVLTASWRGSAENFSVGGFCCDFANADLSLPYELHLPTVPGKLPASFHPEDVFLKNEQQWKREGKPLYEMQIEVCQRAVQQWAAIEGTLPGRDGRSHKYTAEEKAQFSKSVANEIAELKRKKKAAFLAPLLPWLAAPSGWEGFDAQRANDVRRQYEEKLR